MDETKTFDAWRREFAPYGLTCEKWRPLPIPRIDRHNEIEINFFPSGGATYVMSDREVRIPARRMIAFWAMLPHKTDMFVDDEDYYVCTIPLTTFLSWKISEEMQRDLLSGQVLVVDDLSMATYDEMLLEMWYESLKDSPSVTERETVMLEMRARMKRFSLGYERIAGNVPVEARSSMTSGEVLCSSNADIVSRLVVYISTNFNKPLKASDIGKAVGLHPDYANAVFRKAFGCTLHEYLLTERIRNVQRLLSTTDFPITEIGLSCGFATIARFNANFQKICGCTPSEYRRRNR